jgi:hypothetical protein
MSLGTAWINEVKMALLRLKDLEERIEALENPPVVVTSAWSPEPVYIEAEVTATGGPVHVIQKRKPGRPRKHGN